MSRSPPPGVRSPPRSISVDSIVSYFLSPPLIISIPDVGQLVGYLQTFIDQNRDKWTEYPSIINVEFVEIETTELCIHLPKLFFRSPKKFTDAKPTLTNIYLHILFLRNSESLQIISVWESV